MTPSAQLLAAVRPASTRAVRADGGTGTQTTQTLWQMAAVPTPLVGRTSELVVLQLVAQGLSSKAIAQRLFMSTNTVNHHVSSIFHKLGVDTRAHAVAVAAQQGLV